MRRIVTAITAAAMALSLVSMAMPANAVAGYDSAYAGESAFLTLNPGQSGSFTVFFQNTGTTAWARGTASQVDLAACQEDKVTCNAQDASEAPFASGWLSTTRYATHTQTTVAPGSIGTFTYNVAVPSGQAAGTYRFNGALVLSSTGADIRNEGYYQDVTVPTATGSCTPTTITTTPTSANNQVGVTHTQSATVTCAIPTGGTTAPASVGTQVTFVVDAPTGSLNADTTLTATTDANGIATVTWTRSNPDVDTVAVYPTSTPAVRASATKTWSAGAFVVQCEPTAAATLLAGTSRTYTVTVRNPTSGALVAAGQNVTLDFVETSGTPTLSATTITTGSGGTATFSVTGTDTQKGTPRASVQFTSGGTTYRANCGTVTFEAVRAATVTVTPDTAATNANNARRTYTITAVDQFGAAFTGALQISFTELTDSDATTTTAAIVESTHPGTTAPTANTGTCQAAGGFSGNQKQPITLGASGQGFFQICSAAATTANPVVWHDRDGNGVPGTGEAQDTGGAKTWAAPTTSGAALSPASATNTASSENPATNNGSIGEERYRSFLTDQSGNQRTSTTDTVVTFTVRNTSSSGDIVITECKRVPPATLDAAGTIGTATPITVAANTSATCTVTIPASSTDVAVVEVDRSAWANSTTGVGGAGSATIDASLNTGATVFTATQATKTWVASGTVVTSATDTTSATGTVVAFDASQNVYTLSTSVGNVTIYFGTAGDVYTVDGTTATVAQFKSNLTIGDSIERTSSGTATHKLTNK